MQKSKKIMILLGSISPIIGLPLFSVSCKDKSLESTLKSAIAVVEDKNKLASDVKVDDVKITLNSKDFEVIEKSITVKNTDKTILVVKFKIINALNNRTSDFKTIEITGFKNPNANGQGNGNQGGEQPGGGSQGGQGEQPGGENQQGGGSGQGEQQGGGTQPSQSAENYTYAELWNDVNKDKSMYKLSSMSKIKFEDVDTSGLSHSYDRKVKLSDFKPNKISQEQLEDWYNKTFGNFYEDIEKMYLYKAYAEGPKLASLLTAYGANADYFKNHYDNVIRELEDTMEPYNEEFKELLTRLTNEGMSSEAFYTLTGKVDLQAKIWEKLFKDQTEKQNNILSRLAKLTVDPEHKYFKDEKTKKEKLAKLKINQTLTDAKLNKVREIFRDHKAEEFTIEVPSIYGEDFQYTSNVPKWLKDHLSENSIKYTPDPKYTEQQFYQDFFLSSVFEIELARQLYNTLGEGYYVDLTTLGEWELNLDTPGKVLLNVKTQQWRTSMENQKKLNDFVVETLNNIIDDRWDDQTKVEAIRSYLLYKLYYATDEEIEAAQKNNSFNNSMGLSFADPYNLMVGGSVVCDGYSRTFALFMYYLGISTRYMGGIGFMGEISEGEEGEDDSSIAHAWNEVWLEKNGKGAWYPLDLTWDDGQEAGKDSFDFSYDFYLQSKVNGVDFAKSHRIDPVLKQFYIKRPTPLK
ncbi:transglutaminase domain-containing protein [Metamycoplasma hyosynoviae]|nr:transglutaminase domain-containing protein [Metamycoplasma hyosynoviae]MDC8916680.1 transglutaminase domain-containing protein [Metamycoplasma hyosynoviae]MDD7894825.1 transglutaminase domain-containing protein [Metamycoplasma hyosynoviae]